MKKLVLKPKELALRLLLTALAAIYLWYCRDQLFDCWWNHWRPIW